MRMIPRAIPRIPVGDDCDSVMVSLDIVSEKERLETTRTDPLPQRTNGNAPLPTPIFKPRICVEPLDVMASLAPPGASPSLTRKSDKARSPKTHSCSPSGKARSPKTHSCSPSGKVSVPKTHTCSPSGKASVPKTRSPSGKASVPNTGTPSRVLVSKTCPLLKASVASGALVLKPSRISGPSPPTAGTSDTTSVSTPCTPLLAEKGLLTERRPSRPLKILDKSLKELQVNAMDFYANYCGHPLEHLLNIYEVLKYKERKTEVIWLLGDGTIDNKHWLYKMHKRKMGAMHHEGYTEKAINGFEQVLVPRRMVQDIAYHINAICAQEAPHMCCINTAVENSTLAERSNTKILKSKRVPVYVQDLMCRDLLTSRDTLIVSIGGNDIVAIPSTKTIASICSLLAFGSQSAIAAGTAVGMAHFIKIFKTKIEDYINTIVIKTLPRRILVGMTYFIDDQTDYDAWVNSTLCKLGCKVDPVQLKCIIRAIFQHATKKIRIPGTEVIPVPLYETLNGLCSEDYETFVEPSVQGGGKLARSLFDCVERSEMEMCAGRCLDLPTLSASGNNLPRCATNLPRSVSESALPPGTANESTECSTPGGRKAESTSGATVNSDVDRIGINDDGPKVAEEGSRLVVFGGNDTDKTTAGGDGANLERSSSGWVGAAVLRKNFKFKSFARIRRMGSKSVAKYQQIL
eukprot:GEMP01012175.1.p1 GENE.GEMP01012175.1~~GEMP01012175.1.p1  ORF type:complete len:688 (+),score=125.85 GEMP01012175.1:314-2377(+)